MKKVLAVDIDGVLTIETEGHDYEKRSPNLIVIELINLLSNHYKIILYTARFEQDRQITINWLAKYGVKYDNIILEKLHYDYLIDDKKL